MSNNKEIVHHAIIASAITVSAAIFEWAKEELRTSHNLIIQIFSILATAIFVFGAVYAFSSLIERKVKRALKAQPIMLADIGLVDGIFIDAVYSESSDPSELTGGSVLKITSTQDAGFEISGQFYKAENFESIGHFHGRGYTADPSSFIFKYEGGEKNKDDQGVGYYKFRRNLDGNLAFEGIFTRLNLGYRNRVVGRRLKKEEEERGPEQCLQDFLTAAKPHW